MSQQQQPPPPVQQPAPPPAPPPAAPPPPPQQQPTVSKRLPPPSANALSFKDAFKNQGADPPVREAPADPVARPSVYAQTLLDNPGVVANPSHEWLIYESVFNHHQFIHGTDRQRMGAYELPLETVHIVLAPGLPETTVTAIRETFFPSVPDNATLRLALFAPWLDQYSPQQEAKAKAGRVAHMPYNFVANSADSAALGTRWLPPDAKIPIAKKLGGEWAMWQTASRSCVLQLASSAGWAPVSVAARQNENQLFGKSIPVIPWDFRDRAVTTVPPNSNVKRVAELSNPINPNAPEVPQGSDPNIQPLCIGVKTGIFFVGEQAQTEKESQKMTLEKDALAAALRSNYIIALEASMQRRTSPAYAVAHQIVILPELLTVTCVDASLDEGMQDGFQLRDLTRLHRGSHYVPALSVPYLGNRDVVPVTDASQQQKLVLPGEIGYTPPPPVNFDTRSDYFDGLIGPAAGDWANFWSQEFASRIGQAKAILHLVYGLQPLTPNAQNFLLEFPIVPGDKMVSTSRVVTRDVLDMKLHSEWVATVLTTRLPTDVTSTSIAGLAGRFRGFGPGDEAIVYLLQYEATAPSILDSTVKTPMVVDSETFADILQPPPKTTVPSQVPLPRTVKYYGGTQLNFFPYTSLHRGSEVASPSKTSSSGPARIPKRWQRILFTNAEWGLAHAKDYAATVNKLLGLEIPWKTFETKVTLGEVQPSLKQNGGARFVNAKTGLEVNVATDPYQDVEFDFNRTAAIIPGLGDTADGWKRAGELHDLFCLWERRVSRIIHDAIYASPAGRQALRRFHGLT